MDKARGRVIFSIFPVKEILKIVDLGEHECKLPPLFNINANHHFCHRLESFLTSRSIVIHVPLYLNFFLYMWPMVPLGYYGTPWVGLARAGADI